MYHTIFRNSQVTVGGQALNVGDKAPDFTATNQDLSPFNFYSIEGTTIISVVPSLDTRICDIQTAHFYQQVLQDKKLNIVTISMDLPFAQARWCQAQHVDEASASRFVLVSDFKDRDFGQKYGLTILENGLLARAILVIDSTRVVRYTQYLEQISTEPNYQSALDVARNYL
ncbi:MAG: thiol peroxidase [Brevinema sp.]